MPQVDKLTFLSTLYWLFAFYFFFYLDLNINHLYTYLANHKKRSWRILWIMRKAKRNRSYTRFFVSTTGL